MACVLRLHETDLLDSPIDREVKCRVWWSLFMAERWCPPGLGLPRHLIKSEKMLDYPMDEGAFQAMSPTTHPDDFTRRGGLWKHKVTLVDILGPIQDLHMSLLSKRCEYSLLDDGVELLSGRLTDWHNSLPHHVVMNAANLDLHRDKGQGGTFVALHLGYHHYSTLLFYQYLDTMQHTTSAARNFAEMCRQHALSFSRLLHRARLQGDCHVLYLTVAHMTTVSSSVLLHMLLMGDETTIETAKVHLMYNFEALIELRKYWSSVHNVIDRLIVFQNACLRQRNAHHVDDWMVRFLLEHALPFEDKTMREDLSKSTSLLTSTDLAIDSTRAHLVDEVFNTWYHLTQ